MTAQRVYVVSAVASSFLHLSFLYVLNCSYLYCSLAPMPIHKRVELELVDSRIPDPDEEDVKSNLIDEVQSKARDTAPAERGGALPKSEGAGEVKDLQQTLPSEEVPGARVEQQPTPVVEETVTEPEQEEQEVQEEKSVPEAIKEQFDEGDIAVHKHVTETMQRYERQLPRLPSTAGRTPTQAERARLFKNLQSEAEELGVPSFATRKHEIVTYLKKMRLQVFEAWFPLISMKTGAMPDSRVVLEFKIKQSGEVKDIRVTSFEGSRVFPDICMAAIRKAAPFEEVPLELPGFLKDHALNIKFSFYFN